MASRPSDDDERLLRELGSALRGGAAVQERITTIGEGAFAWYGVDDELEFASLIHDSLLNEELTVRGELHRTVMFACSSVTVQVERSAGLVVGQVVPAVEGDICVLLAGGDSSWIRTDELGCFSLPEVPAEAFRLRWRTATADVVTDWIRL
ncbi:hypothetical protein [Actinoplanes aureus]|uniref:Uncharacterized protein n=1 Tax=Actinoplanes aureus TaxID=2792083 RepID=A0A931CGU1_9ACTN|nr:hypothetical protein [Actinoplanes aureus]MBG0564655.1 hypothetical protein [Actinoplanes aureus]